MGCIGVYIDAFVFRFLINSNRNPRCAHMLYDVRELDLHEAKGEELEAQLCDQRSAHADIH